jgi:Flp pilus assembly protein TadD
MRSASCSRGSSGPTTHCPNSADLEPERARYAYVYAVALHSAGRGTEALTVLKESLARHPGDRDTLQALVSFSRDAADVTSALAYAERLSRVLPDDVNLAALIDRLRRQLVKP